MDVNSRHYVLVDISSIINNDDRIREKIFSALLSSPLLGPPDGLWPILSILQLEELTTQPPKARVITGHDGCFPLLL